MIQKKSGLTSILDRFKFSRLCCYLLCDLRLNPEDMTNVPYPCQTYFELVIHTSNGMMGSKDDFKDQKRAIDDLPFPDSKRSKGTADCKQSPTRIVTWNANGLIPRCKFNEADLQRLVQETDHPDIICIQEARVKGDANHQPVRDEATLLDPVMNKIFPEYQRHWSLTVGKRYAGTLTLVHKRIFVQDAVFTPDAAIDTLIQRNKTKRAELKLNPIKLDCANASQPKQSQKTLQSFFVSKKSPKDTQNHHTAEGRFQWLSFRDWDLLNTYVPNNSSTEESRSRRKDWDDGMLEFVRQRKELAKDRPFLWCGDVNCTSSSKDGSHSSTTEYWRSRQAMTFPDGTPDEHIGAPGFTPAERKRFQVIQHEGNLCDIWRHLHPNGDSRCSNTSVDPWELPNYTWRGNKGKYYGRGQRIDGFWTTPNRLQNVKDCKILGWGSDRQGLFCGSDHCAMLLEFQSTDDQIEGRNEQGLSNTPSVEK